MTSFVWSTLAFVGFHRWPHAAVMAGQQRAYLADRHRHRFEVRVTARVAHDDRQIEFHDLQAETLAFVESYPAVYGGGRELGSRSCEVVAVELHDHLEARWPGQVCEVEVSEDGENGALVQW